MGLAASQARLLCLTARKADCEYGISINAMQKMALTREQSELAQEYNSRLQSKQISFYANGQYNKINYQYLMGYGKDYTRIWDKNYPMKNNLSMVLTDYNGRVVLNNDYANAITSVLGNEFMDSNGKGKTFDKSRIPEILAELTGVASADEFKTVMNGGSTDASYSGHSINTITQEVTRNNITVDSSSADTDKIQAIIDFYLPIFQAAASNGWTTEYNNEMASNPDYISDAIVSGTFRLETIDTFGNYDEGSSLMYFLTAGEISQSSNSAAREEITAWYNAEKARIGEIESYLDLKNQDLSTELEAIKTEMESIKSIIDDATNIFNWGNNG